MAISRLDSEAKRVFLGQRWLANSGDVGVLILVVYLFPLPPHHFVSLSVDA
jgi:hypothetical protein